MSKCEYCIKEVEAYCIRCTTCDSAWQDGHKAGYKSHFVKVRETARTLIRLCGYDVDEQTDDGKD